MMTQQTVEQFREHGKTLVLVVAALGIAIALVGLSACSTPSTSNTSVTVTNENSTSVNRAVTTNTTPAAGAVKPGAVPASLVNAGEYGENIYDFAKAKNWTKTSARLNALKDATKQLHADVSGANTSEFDSTVAALEKDIAAKDQQATMRDANHATLLTADMTASYKPAVPIEVVKLDYYGRELEVWSAAKDTAKLQTTASEMSRTWNALRPTLEAHGGATEAKRFGELIARVEAAKSPADYARLATPILDEVDNLEKVFEKK